MKKTNPQVDACFHQAGKWRKEMTRLRDIVLGFPLMEELKWDKPFYTHEGNNVLVIWNFKSHCALGFCKGALLRDPHGILVKPGENTQAVRKIPFTSLEEITKRQRILQAYIREAIEAEKAGREVVFKKITEFALPGELQARFEQDASLLKAFHALTPGRQRGYLLHFSAPKQSATRASRIEKWAPQILKGIGFHDRPKAKSPRAS